MIFVDPAAIKQKFDPSLAESPLPAVAWRDNLIPPLLAWWFVPGFFLFPQDDGQTLPQVLMLKRAKFGMVET